MSRLAGVVVLVVALLAACGGGGPDDPDRARPEPPGRTDEPPVESDREDMTLPTILRGSWTPASDVEGVSRVGVPEGEAAVELVVESEQLRRGEQAQFHLVNRGEVDLMSGLGFGVERWNGDSWVEVSWPDGHGWPDIGIVLPPDGSTASEMMETWPWQQHEWPSKVHEVEPGWYRLSKYAWYEDPALENPYIHLVSRARLVVTE